MASAKITKRQAHVVGHLNGKPVYSVSGGHDVFELQEITGRYRYDDGSETAAHWMSPAGEHDGNLSGAEIEVGFKFRLRFLVQEVGAGSASGTCGGQLQYSYGATAFTNVTTTSTHIRAVSSSNVSDGDATTQQLGSGTFVAGKISTTGNAGDVTLGDGEETELEYVLELQSAVTHGTNIEFRIVGEGDDTTVFSNAPATATWLDSTEIAVATLRSDLGWWGNSAVGLYVGMIGTKHYVLGTVQPSSGFSEGRLAVMSSTTTNPADGNWTLEDELNGFDLTAGIAACVHNDDIYVVANNNYGTIQFGIFDAGTGAFTTEKIVADADDSFLGNGASPIITPQIGIAVKSDGVAIIVSEYYDGTNTLLRVMSVSGGVLTDRGNAGDTGVSNASLSNLVVDSLDRVSWVYQPAVNTLKVKSISDAFSVSSATTVDSNQLATTAGVIGIDVNDRITCMVMDVTSREWRANTWTSGASPTVTDSSTDLTPETLPSTIDDIYDRALIVDPAGTDRWFLYETDEGATAADTYEIHDTGSGWTTGASVNTPGSGNNKFFAAKVGNDIVAVTGQSTNHTTETAWRISDAFTSAAADIPAPLKGIPINTLLRM